MNFRQNYLPNILGTIFLKSVKTFIERYLLFIPFTTSYNHHVMGFVVWNERFYKIIRSSFQKNTKSFDVMLNECTSDLVQVERQLNLPADYHSLYAVDHLRLSYKSFLSSFVQTTVTSKLVLIFTCRKNIKYKKWLTLSAQKQFSLSNENMSTPKYQWDNKKVHGLPVNFKQQYVKVSIPCTIDINQ